MPRSLTGRPTTKRENKYQLYKCFSPEGEIFCFCDTEPRLAAVLRTTQTNRNGNLGRQFWACPGTDEQCEFFLWNDQLRENGYVGYLDVADSDWEEQDEDMFGVGPQERYGQRLGDDTAGMRTPPPTPQKKKKKQPAAAKQNKSKKRDRAESEDDEDEDDDDDSDGDSDVQVTPRSGSKRSKSSSSKGSSSQKKQKVPIGGSPTQASRRKSPASPAEGPSGGGAEAEIAHLKREMAAMKRQMQAKDKATTQLAKENDEYRAENSQLLEKAYPELFTPSQGAQG